MKNVHTLSTLKQVKALTDPLRLRVLEVFIRQQVTTKQAATLLGETATKLYHHVQILEDAGLIRLVETRKNRGTVEKYYRAVAEDFVVDRHLLELTRGPTRATKEYESLFLSALEATLSDARKSVAAGLIKPIQEGRNALVYRRRFCGSEAAIKELMARVQGWIAECQAAEEGQGEVQYGLTIAFYPVRKRPGARATRRQARSKREGKTKDSP
jgi:DNA-binding transcriptional ArsR family regulator